MNQERLRQIFRQFPQNGMKLLLSEPANVRELLTLADAPLLPRIDFGGMKVEPTDFVTRDFRHVEFEGLLRQAVGRLEAIADVEQLEAWLDRVVTAKSFKEMGIASRG